MHVKFNCIVLNYNNILISSSVHIFTTWQNIFLHFPYPSLTLQLTLQIVSGRSVKKLAKASWLLDFLLSTRFEFNLNLCWLMMSLQSSQECREKRDDDGLSKVFGIVSSFDLRFSRESHWNYYYFAAVFTWNELLRLNYPSCYAFWWDNVYHVHANYLIWNSQIRIIHCSLWTEWINYLLISLNLECDYFLCSKLRDRISYPTSWRS